MIDRDGEVKDVSRFNAVADDQWAFAQSADNDDQGCQGGRRDGETSAGGEHAHCGDLHSSGGEVNAAGPAHCRKHRPVQAGNPSRGGSDDGEHASGGGGDRVGLDRPQLSADVGHAADVGVPNDVHQPERSLVGGYLDQRLNVNVTVFDQPAALVAVRVHLRMCRGRPAQGRDDERGERQRRSVLGEQASGGGDIHLE